MLAVLLLRAGVIRARVCGELARDRTLVRSAQGLRAAIHFQEEQGTPPLGTRERQSAIGDQDAPGGVERNRQRSIRSWVAARKEFARKTTGRARLSQPDAKVDDSFMVGEEPSGRGPA